MNGVKSHFSTDRKRVKRHYEMREVSLFSWSLVGPPIASQSRFSTGFVSALISARQAVAAFTGVGTLGSIPLAEVAPSDCRVPRRRRHSLLVQARVPQATTLARRARPVPGSARHHGAEPELLVVVDRPSDIVRHNDVGVQQEEGRVHGPEPREGRLFPVAVGVGDTDGRIGAGRRVLQIGVGSALLQREERGGAVGRRRQQHAPPQVVSPRILAEAVDLDGVGRPNLDPRHRPLEGLAHIDAADREPEPPRPEPSRLDRFGGRPLHVRRRHRRGPHPALSRSGGVGHGTPDTTTSRRLRPGGREVRGGMVMEVARGGNYRSKDDAAHDGSLPRVLNAALCVRWLSVPSCSRASQRVVRYK
jgi:hypothetical protein